jgi:hypothetical protein
VWALIVKLGLHEERARLLVRAQRFCGSRGFAMQLYSTLGFVVRMPLLGLKELFRSHTNLILQDLKCVSQAVIVFPGPVVLCGVYDQFGVGDQSW